MASEPSEEDNQGVIERMCRVVMDVRVRITRITRASVAGYFTPDETGRGLPWEWAERQNRLLSALLEDDEYLEQFLAAVVRAHLELLVDSRQSSGMPADEEEDRLFERVFNRMSSEDATYFREAMRDGLFAENIELLNRAFITGWRDAEIKTICVAKGAGS